MPIVKRIRRFHSSIVVSSRQVATEISNLVSGSNIEQSGRSSAAPLNSNRPIKKRVNNAERRQMLESFVNKYRATNMGKFPSPTTARKEVGGGYYSIKRRLQEMEYNLKMSHVEKGPTEENIKQTKGDDALSQEIAMESSGSQEKSNSQITTDKIFCEDPLLEFESNFDKNSQITGDDALSQEIGMESSGSQEKSDGRITIDQNLCEDHLLESESIYDKNIQIKGDDALSQEIAVESSGSQEESNGQRTIYQNLCEDPWLESGSSSDKSTDPAHSNITKVASPDDTHNLATGSDEKLECPRDDSLSFKDTETELEKPADETMITTRDKREEENEVKEKASLWGNLKSLANGFINMWKK